MRADNGFRDVTERPRLEASTGETERRARELLESLPAAIYTTDVAGRLTFLNAAAAELWGRRPELGESEFPGSWKLFSSDGERLPRGKYPIAMALREKRAIRGRETIAERPDGSRISFIPYPTPLFDRSGELVGAVNLMVDITERRAAEERPRAAAAQCHRDGEIAQRLAAIVESSDDAILTKDLKGIITSWNRGAERLFGYTPHEVIGKPITILIPPERRHEEPVILSRIQRGERVDHYETVRRCKDGQLVEISLSVSPVRNAEGKIVGASKIARDITERKRAQERQNLLLAEMEHRIRNLFTLASGLVTLSARSATTATELAEVVRHRLQALAQAQTLTLPRQSEDGVRTPRPTTLHALIRAIVSPYDDQMDGGGARVTITGQDVQVGARSATSLALLVHEFTTNAAKYGALSTPAGRIDIACAEDDDHGQILVTWKETGGPPNRDGIARDGFGTLLARTTVAGQLGGGMSRDWTEGGLTIRFSVNRSRIAG